MRFKTTLLLSSALVLGFAAAARAQEARLEEVIVTAQKRAEDVQRTPLAITAVTSATLEERGVVNPMTLQTITPSLHVFERGGTGANVSVRGVVSIITSPQGDPSVALNVDDLYLPRPQSVNTLFYDLARIEVLRGPQGTLFGRNATAGAINVISNNPVHQFEGAASVEVGSYDTLVTSGMANIPLTDKLAARAAFQTYRHDGYIGDLEDANDIAGRVKLLYQPTDELNILAWAHYAKRSGRGPADVRYPYVSPSDPYVQALYPATAGGLNEEFYGFGLRADWNVRFATVTYIAGYEALDFNQNQITQLAAVATVDETSKATSHELRITSNTASDKAGSLRWVAGLYFFKEDQTYYPVIRSGILTAISEEPAIPSTSKAAFAQATYSVTDRLRLTAGLRYTKDHKSQTGLVTQTLGPIHLVIPVSGSVDFHKTNYKLGVEFDVAPKAMLFASVSTGYHSGGLIDSVLPPNNVYLPEEITDYEVGLKSRWFDERLQVNANAFYYDYRNMHANAIRPPFFPTVFNAKKATLKGVEIETQWLITEDDQLSATVIYEDTKFNDFCIPSPPFVITGQPLTSCHGAPGYDNSNFPFPYVSKWTGTVSYRHIFHLANGAKLTPQVSTYLRTSYYGTISLDPAAHLKGYSRTDATLTYDAPSDRWSVMAYVRNIENDEAPTSSQNILGSYYRTLSPPRTYGVRASARF